MPTIYGSQVYAKKARAGKKALIREWCVLPASTRHKRVRYFERNAAAERCASIISRWHKGARVVAYDRGFAVQLRKSGPYLAGFGEMPHSASKAKRFLFRHASTPAYEHSQIFLGAKKSAIHLRIVRTYEKGGAFKAEACMGAHANWTKMYRSASGPSIAAHNRRKNLRCHIAQGPSPTRAVKRATAGLLKKL